MSAFCAIAIYRLHNGVTNCVTWVPIRWNCSSANDISGTWLRAAAEGSGCIALVSGEAGIGKTALLQEFADRQTEVRVLWGACDALFTPRPLAPLHDIARQTQGALLAAVESGANRDATFAATLDELEREQQILVVFEDMHWADEASLDLLKFLGRRIHRSHAIAAESNEAFAHAFSHILNKQQPLS